MRNGIAGKASLFIACLAALLIPLAGAGQSSGDPASFDKLDKGNGRLNHNVSLDREAGTHVLFDFEGSEVLGKWAFDDGASAELVKSPWPGSGQAIHIKFLGRSGMHWPNMRITSPNIRWPERTLPTTVLSFRLKNLKPVRSPFRLALKGSLEGLNWEIAEFQVPALAEREVVINIGQGPSGSLAGIDQWTFWVSQPREDCEFILDDVVLSPGIAEALSKARSEFRSAYGILESQSDQSARKVMGERLRSLRAELHDLENSVDNLAGLDQVETFMKDLDEVRERVVTARGMPGHLRAESYLAMGKSKSRFALGIESSMTKVHYNAYPFSGQFGTDIRIEAARGEFEHAQVVVVPVESSLKNVRWKASALTGPEGKSIPVAVRTVGYFKTKTPPYPVEYEGWWPDPLLDYLEAVDVPADAVQPLWLTVRVPEDAPAGEYTGKLTVTANGSDTQEINVRLKVWNFAVPSTRHMRTAVNFNRPSSLYGNHWADSMKEKYYKFVWDHRLNVDWIYSEGGTEGCLLDQPVEVVREFKREGQNFITIGFLDLFNQDPEAWMDRVEKRYAKAKEAGVEDMLWFYGFDELHLDREEEMADVMRKVKERFPWARIMTTIVDPTFGADNSMRDLVDAWVPTADVYEKHPDAIDAARRRGVEVWWYVCVGPYSPYAGFLIEQPGTDARMLMGMMYQKYRPQGFLYYSLTRQDNNTGRILDTGPLCDYNAATWSDLNGEGCFFFPGPKGPVSSIRFENFTDGIEDYEYYWVLEDLLRKVDAKQDTLSSAEKKVIENARSRTVVPDSVVRTLTDYTHSPADLLEARRAVAESIESLVGVLE